MEPRGTPPKPEAMTAAARKRCTLLAAVIGLNITILDETVVFLALPAIMPMSVGLGLLASLQPGDSYLSTSCPVSSWLDYRSPA